MTPSLPERISLAANWLLETGIRNKDPNYSSFGSINHGYRVSSKGNTYSYAFTEITGYAISCFLNFAKWFDNTNYFEAAQQAGEYLLRIQNLSDREAYGAFMHSRDLVSEQSRDEYYSFDAAVCINGLLDLYESTGNVEYRKASELAGQWLVEKMQKSDGSFLALYDGSMKRYGKTDIEHMWYYDGGCLHAKNIIALLKLARVSGKSQFQNAARNACNWALQLQNLDGGIWRNKQRDYIFTHAHCYATEGLIYAAWVLEEEVHKQAVMKAADWLLLHQGKDGSFLYEYENSVRGMKRLVQNVQHNNYRELLRKKRTDATAQAVRIWLILYCLFNDSKYLRASQSAIDFLFNVQCINSSDKQQVGGIYHGCLDLLLFQLPEHTLSSWCTMFSASALYMFNEARHNRLDVSKSISELF